MDAASLLAAARRNAGLTQAELARRARTSQAAVARYESGVVSPAVATLDRLIRAAGAQLRLTLEAAPSVDLSTPQAASVRRHRNEILDRCRRSGARNVRLFGSVARGTAREDSDIDLLIEFDSSKGLLPLLALRDDLSALLGYPTDVVPEDVLRDDVARTALAEAVPV